MAQANPSQSKALVKSIDAVVLRAISENRIVGTVILVAQAGKILYLKASGLADREAKRAMQEDAVFRLASMTKPIVSVAVLKLADERKIKLDDPVTKWLPDFRPKLPSGWRRR